MTTSIRVKGSEIGTLAVTLARDVAEALGAAESQLEDEDALRAFADGLASLARATSRARDATATAIEDARSARHRRIAEMTDVDARNDLIEALPAHERARFFASASNAVALVLEARDPDAWIQYVPYHLHDRIEAELSDLPPRVRLEVDTQLDAFVEVSPQIAYRLEDAGFRKLVRTYNGAPVFERPYGAYGASSPRTYTLVEWSVIREADPLLRALLASGEAKARALTHEENIRFQLGRWAAGRGDLGERERFPRKPRKSAPTSDPAPTDPLARLRDLQTSTPTQE